MSLIYYYLIQSKIGNYRAREIIHDGKYNHLRLQARGQKKNQSQLKFETIDQKNERPNKNIIDYFKRTSEINDPQTHQSYSQPDSESFQLKVKNTDKQQSLSKYMTKDTSVKTKIKPKQNSLKKKMDTNPMKQAQLFPVEKKENIAIPLKIRVPPAELPILITPHLIKQKYLFYFRNLILDELGHPLMNNICQKVVDFTLTQKVKYLIEGESQISYQSLLKFTKFILYKLIIPQNSMNWETLYNPETSQDFFDDRNARYLKFWLKISFYQLKKGKKQKQSKDDFIIDESQEEESAAFSSTAFTELDQDILYQLKVDPGTQKWKYSILKIFGGQGIGKSSLIKSIAKEMRIEVIETNEFTEKKVFEELFQSQKLTASKTFFQQQKPSHVGKQPTKSDQDVFNINEKSNRKKLILHRSELPKYFPSLLADQKVPMIWLSGQEKQLPKANDSIDYFEFIQHTNLETAILVFLILTIEENCRLHTANITKIINEQLSYQKLTDIDLHKKFFSSFDIIIEDELQKIKVSMNHGNLMTNLNFSEVVELTFKFQGNIRLTLNWIEFYHHDKQLRFSMLQQLRSTTPHMTQDQIYERIIYSMQNIKDPQQKNLLESVEINFEENQDLESYCAKLIHQQDNDIHAHCSKRYQDAQEIIYARQRIIKKYFQPIVYQSLKRVDYFTINMTFKLIALEHFQNEDSKMKTRRNQQEKINQIDIYQSLFQQTIKDPKDYRLFKYFDQLERYIFRRGKLRLCQVDSSL